MVHAFIDQNVIHEFDVVKTWSVIITIMHHLCIYKLGQPVFRMI